jgi:drug/metabolite transporter (DMT)-like permease
MTPRALGHVFIFAMIALTAYGQLALKWRVDRFGPLPPGFVPASRHILFLLFDPMVISAFAAAFLASLAWMAALSRFPLSYAYPFTSLTFVLVLAISICLFGETLTLNKVAGVVLIALGVFVATASAR